jgi:hypothetical protein
MATSEDSEPLTWCIHEGFGMCLASQHRRVLTACWPREGNNSVTFPMSAIAVTRSDTIRQDVDMGTVRLNYRFGGPIVAKY